MSEVRAIGTGRQLFIDDRYIERSDHVELVMNPPRKMGPIIRQDQPWRSKLTGYYGTVIADNGLYKMWTNCGEGDTGDEHSFGVNYGKNRYMQYLISTNGLDWESPSLGAVDFRGSRDNNLVTTGDNMEGTVFVDPLAPAESRYKYLRYVCHDGLFLSHSPDGIHWHADREHLLNYMFDSQNVVFYDRRLRKYACYLRGWESPRRDPATGAITASAARNVVRMEVDDLRDLRLLQREEPPGRPAKFVDRLPAVIRCDEQDPPETDVYTNAVVQYPLADDVYFAFPALYSKFPVTADARNDGILEVQMAVSRDGCSWKRIRQPYVRTGPVGETDSASVYMYTGMVIRETEIYQYYWGSQYTHGGKDTYAKWPGINRNAVFALAQRIDGFMSADFGYAGGSLLTKPFTFAGSRLSVNLDTAATGLAAIAVLDEEGHEIPGYEAEACDPIKGNYIDRTVSWRGQTDLTALQSRPVRLKFAMRNCKLYAYRFV